MQGLEYRHTNIVPRRQLLTPTCDTVLSIYFETAAIHIVVFRYYKSQEVRVSQGVSVEIDAMPHGGAQFTNVAEAKRMLRHGVFVRRRGTSLSMSMQAGEQCAQIACEAGLFQSPSRIIACHVSMGTEISTIPLLSIALGCGYTVLVPKMGADLDLGWGVLRSLDDLLHLHVPDEVAVDQMEPSLFPHAQTRRPGEPEGQTYPPEALQMCSTVIVPALLVNPAGVRLGRGAAWYDRALRFAGPQADLMAMCWPWEFVDAPLPCEEHDVRMNAVLTPRGFTRLGSTGPTRAHTDDPSCDSPAGEPDE